ncbi:hypothetical protein PHMEG_0008459, partial [Phytophthora megakarya]
VQVEVLKQTAENSVVAHIITSLTVRLSTLQDEFLYPGTVSNERWSKVTAKLLGSVRFSWNSSTNCVDGLLSQSDMVTPLLQLLGNIDNVSLLLGNARVTPEGSLVVGDYFSAYPFYC